MTTKPASKARKPASGRLDAAWASAPNTANPTTAAIMYATRLIMIRPEGPLVRLVRPYGWRPQMPDCSYRTGIRQLPFPGSARWLYPWPTEGSGSVPPGCAPGPFPHDRCERTKTWRLRRRPAGTAADRWSLPGCQPPELRRWSSPTDPAAVD